MNRQLLIQTLAIAGLGFVAFGATLYAVNSPERTLLRVLLVTGLSFLVIYAILNARALRTFASRRSSRHGANMIAVIALFIAILAIVQAMSARHNLRYDLTRNKRFSLAPQTVAVLEKLRDDLKVTGFFQSGDAQRVRAENLIDQYSHHSSHFKYEFIDPDQKPQAAEDLGVTNYNTTVVRYGNRTELILDLTEETLTNAILRVTSDVTKSIYFVYGHGEKNPGSEERDGYSIARDAIERQNYLVRTLSLFEEEAVPDDCYLLVVAGPTKDYFSEEVKKIESYLLRGRNGLFMIDARVDTPNIAALLAMYGIQLDNVVIIDPFSRVFGSDYTVPVVTEYLDHPINRGLDVATLFPLARSVRPTDELPSGVTVDVLASTGKSAWGERDLDGVRNGKAIRDAEDIRGPVPVAVVASAKIGNGEIEATGTEESKLVVFGDSDFASNSSFRLSGNSDLLLNTVHYLAEEKDLVAIRAKQSTGDQLLLRASQGRLIFLLSVVILPLSVMAVGTTVFIRRRQRG